MQISTPRSSLIIRFLTVFLLCHFSLYAGTDQTGKQKITIVASDVTMGSLFKQIEKQTGLRFMYAVDVVNVEERVTVAFKKVMLDDVLGGLLGRKGIEWLYRDGVISLRVLSAPIETVTSFKVTDPTITITGKILDIKGNPIPGATVLVKGGKKGAKTDGDGYFVLSGVETNAVLLVSSIGFETKEIVVNSKTMTIKMDEVIGKLDETVIVGYGTTTQRFNTGNVSSVKADDIAKQPVTDPLLALQGRIPGMDISQTTGVQGGQVKVQIRGLNSINSGTQPLFIIDGIPYNPTISPLFGSFGAVGNIVSALSFINPADIESIDVLKDADATAIYGSRGANGVILINTKKGKIGVTKLDLNIYRGIGEIAKKLNLLNTSEYLEMRREAFSNDGAVPSDDPYDYFGFAPDLKLWDTTRNVDWQKELVGRTAHYTNIQLSVSGGNGNLQYLIGGNYNKSTTVFPGNSNNQKGGVHFNVLGASADQRLRAVLTGGYNIEKALSPVTDFADKITLPPNAPPPYNNDGTLNWANSTWENPYVSLISSVYDSRTSNLLGNLELSYRVLPELIIKSNIGCNVLQNNTFNGATIAGIDPKDRINATASGTFTNNETRAWIFEPQINYNKILGNGVLNGIIGGTFQGNNNDLQFTGAYGIREDALIRNQAAATSFFVRNGGSKYKYAAIFGRVGYNLSEKYLLNLTVRRDGSSRFGPRKQFAVFGAIGAGWIFSEETFIRKSIPLLSYGKLRISYGTTGNDQIGDYEYLDRYEFGNTYQNIKTMSVLGLYNPDFAWEVTKKAEIGLETGFWEDRILFSFSHYRNRSSNQLIGYSLPSIVGASLIKGNLPATIENKGIELVLMTKNSKTKNFEWTSSFNLYRSGNKLVSYNENAILGIEEGNSLSEKQITKILGVDPNNGTYLFEGLKGDAVPYWETLATTQIDLAPVYSGGFLNTFRFKSLSVDVFFQYVKQKGAIGILHPDRTPGTKWNQDTRVLKRWRQLGDNTDVPRFTSQDGAIIDAHRMLFNSDKGYSDASFIRCKNLAISWRLPSKWMTRVNGEDGRIYCQAQNLFTITKYTGWDPETQSISVIPPLRVVTVGVQVTL